MLEESWVYFLSFGLVFEAPKLFMTPTQATAFFAVAFPYFIISAVAASPRRTYDISLDKLNIRSTRSRREPAFLGLLPSRLPFCAQSRAVTMSVMSMVRQQQPAAPQRRDRAN